MDRKHFDDDQVAFGEAFRSFASKELVPDYLEWERAGIAPREIFTAAGKHGFLGMAVPEQYGGGGASDFRFNQMLDEQIAAAGVTAAGLGIILHNDTCLPYFLSFCSDEQKQRWLPGIVSGELVTAVAMTEPGAGSDLAGIRTSAVRDGDDYLVNGSKTFITNGIHADLVIAAVRTGEDRHHGMSLLILERGMAGFERGRNLDKLGMHSQDTAELSFTDVRVPAANLLGDEGEGFAQLTQKLPQERMSLAVNGVAEARAAFRETLAYVRDRKAFGKTIGSFQNTKFVLAEVATEVDVAQAFVDQCVLRLNEGTLSAADAAKAKWWCTELQGRVIDKCLQLHGGYGYMTEYAISRRYADARVTRIYGGTTEIMKSVVSKSLELMAAVRFILASASPARLKTLRAAGVDPEVIVSGVDEEELSANSTYDDMRQQVSALAGSKALAVRDRVSGQALILGCDSMLEFDGEALGKPKTTEIAVERWKQMRGKTGYLHTGHCLVDAPTSRIVLTHLDTTVHFADVSDAEIELYCNTGEPQNVAGAFTIDGFGGWFIQRIEGDPHNVVGVSLPTLRGMLTEFGLTIADLGYPTV